MRDVSESELVCQYDYKDFSEWDYLYYKFETNSIGITTQLHIS